MTETVLKIIVDYFLFYSTNCPSLSKPVVNITHNSIQTSIGSVRDAGAAQVVLC